VTRTVLLILEKYQLLPSRVLTGCKEQAGLLQSNREQSCI